MIDRKHLASVLRSGEAANLILKSFPTVADDGAFVGPGGHPSRLPTVIMFNGQSNMAAGPAITIGWSELQALLGPDILGFGYAANAFVPVVDGTCNARANHGAANIAPGTNAGPGLGQMATRVCRWIANITGQTVRTYSGAYSGQGIDYFLPASVTLAKFEDGSSHPSLNNYNWMKSMVATSGVAPQLYVWWQGEADAGTTPSVYRAKLETLWTALQADYPGIKMLVIGTIGNADDRNGSATAHITGVRRAQREFAAAYPDRVAFIDNTDMRGYTAWYQDNHYSVKDASYASHVEVAKRVLAKLRGEVDRPKVEPIAHPQDVIAWTETWGHRKSLTGAGALASWSASIGSNSLAVEAGAPTYVASLAKFGGRNAIRFPGSGGARLTAASIGNGATGTNKWTIGTLVVPDQAFLAGNAQYLWQLESSGGGNRIALAIWFGSYRFNLNGTDFAFDTVAPPLCEGDVPRWLLCTYDGSVPEARLYIDGYLAGVKTGGLSDVSTGANARIRIGSFSGVGLYKGDMGYTAAACNVIATADQSLQIYKGVRVENELYY